jgi:hypothetical protein
LISDLRLILVQDLVIKNIIFRQDLFDVFFSPALSILNIFITETASLCVDDNLRFLSGESKKYDAFINHNPQRTDDKFYPAYIGM